MSRPNTSKTLSYKRGHRAEFYASLILRLKGYKILQTRYKTSVGEVDILAQKKNVLVAVEVKYRTYKSDALESITLKAKKRITRAVEHFIALDPAYSNFDIRFDVITFNSGWFWPFSYTHLDNAWRPRT